MESKYEPEVKCKYSGPLYEYTGYSEANRNFVRAFIEAGVKITCENIPYGAFGVELGETYSLVKDLEGKLVDYDIKILHIPADGYLKHLEPTRYHIGHLFWETDSMSRSWVWNCNLMDEIWTGSYYYKEKFMKAGIKVPIYVFPEPINTKVELGLPFSVPGHKGYMFYSVFQWIERKNPKALLTAYWKEFEGNEDVTLLLKVFRFGFDKEEKDKIRADIAQWKEEAGIVNFPPTILYLDLLNSNDMWRLHFTGDCFVSAHRGEGWGVPQAEAMVLGKPVISTNLGGIHEYVEDGKDAFLVRWKPGKVFNMDFAPWYLHNQSWAEVDEDDLRKKMRFCYEHREEAQKIGLEGQKFAREKLNFKTVGELMRNRLRDIQRVIDNEKKLQGVVEEADG